MSKHTEMHLQVPAWVHGGLMLSAAWVFYQAGVWWMIAFFGLSIAFAYFAPNSPGSGGKKTE